MSYLIGFSIGLLGSLHCVGMCSPLMAVVFQKKNILSSGFLFYQFGRISTYIILGVLAGLAGAVVFLNQLQQPVSISIGVILILFAFFQFWPNLGNNSLTGGLTKIISKLFRQFKGKSHPFSRYVLGFANGLLPCGLVYFGVANAITAENWWQGGVFMLFFGFGTIPALIAAPSILWFLTKYVNQKWNWNQLLFFVFGVLLIVRGLGLGIPYLSPIIDPIITSSSEIICD